MELSCFWELTGLEKTIVIGATLLGIILIALGLIPRFRQRIWEPRVDGKYKDFWASLSVPVIFIITGGLLFLATGWWFANTFPAKHISFSQRPLTLFEIKQRIERMSSLQVDLKRGAGSLFIDKEFSGACASDLLSSICQYYSSKLQCEYDSNSKTFVIAMRP